MAPSSYLKVAFLAVFLAKVACKSSSREDANMCMQKVESLIARLESVVTRVSSNVQPGLYGSPSYYGAPSGQPAYYAPVAQYAKPMPAGAGPDPFPLKSRPSSVVVIQNQAKPSNKDKIKASSKNVKSPFREDTGDKIEYLRSEFDMLKDKVLKATDDDDVSKGLDKFSLRLSDMRGAEPAGADPMGDKARAICKSKVEGLSLTKLGNGVYYFHTDAATGKNWFQASAFCKQHGMELVSIETELENKLLKEQVKSLLGDQADYQSFFWTSLNDLSGEQTWAGTGAKLAFSDWLSDNSSPSGGNEHCSEIWQYIDMPGNIHWNDRDCNTWQGRFICELPEPCALFM